jgi:hypothetical protein
LDRPLEDVIGTTVFQDSGLISPIHNEKGICTLPCESGKFLDMGTGTC